MGLMNRRNIVLASGNKHKVEEIRDILKGLPFNILSKDEVNLRDLDVEEDGDTLEENALKKAKEIAKYVEAIVIADDTGLFVDKLGGKPGVHSARYAGENANYKDNNSKLLKELDGIPLEERTARFETVIAIVMEDKSYRTVKGQCRGKIALSHKGEGGFGYDPLFIVDGYDKTFAELGNDIKNKISHRANALESLKIELQSLIEDDI